MRFIMSHPQSSTLLFEFDLRDNGSMSCSTLDSKQNRRAMQARIDRDVLSVEEGTEKLARFLSEHPGLHKKVLSMWLGKLTSEFGIHS